MKSIKFTTTRFESLSMQNKKRYNINVISLFVVGEDGFEPSKLEATDLQSAPFGHSGTPPFDIVCEIK